MSDNGWRKLGVGINEGSPGDDAVGDHFTVYYEKTGTDWVSDVTFYVVQHDDVPTYVNADLVAFGVEEMTFVGKQDDDSTHEYTYDAGDVRYFDTLELAQERAKELSTRDDSAYYCV